MSKIKDVHALEILDSRGNPTVRTWITLEDGTRAAAGVPSGASTGVHEAHELRDNGDRFHGKGVQQAVRNVNSKIKQVLVGREASNQKDIDNKMIDLDGTESKENLGANAILSASLAIARAAAKSESKPLYEYIRETFDLNTSGFDFPTPTMNVINGGEHADNNLTIQEFMVVPILGNFKQKVRAGAEIFQTLKKILKEKGLPTAVGDEGGFAPDLDNNKQALQLLVQAIEETGYKPGKEIGLAMDIAAGEFFEDDKYKMVNNQDPIRTEEVIDILEDWLEKYPIVSIEDALDQDAWKQWQLLTEKLGDKVDLVGDDLFVTNKKRLQKGIDMNVANSILIKVNQIGSLSETIDTIKLAQKNGYKASVSHRSGETADTFIADLALAVNSEYIKSGSLSRSERVEKYNRLLAIEEQL